MSGPALHPDKVKHLELIQGIVTRLGTCSFLVKGWALTVATAFFVILADRLSWKIAGTAFIPLLVFWLLDAYYLRQERLFRLLYDDVRARDSQVEPFSMDVRPYMPQTTMGKATFSFTLKFFYGALLIVNLAFFIGAVL